MYEQYQNYVQRFQYEPDKWPPDMGLAELHARCSEPGPRNPIGIRCPCCDEISKLKIKHWMRRDIKQDFYEHGAVYAYFFLLKYYMAFILMVILTNSIYSLYATYYVCINHNTLGMLCLQTGVIYYLQYNVMVATLQLAGQTTMVLILEILQAVVFAALLIANVASIFILTRMEHTENLRCPPRLSGNILLLHNMKQQYIPKIKEHLKLDKTIKVLRIIPVREIKKYAETFEKRNFSFYRLMALYVSCEDPLKYKKKNKKLAQWMKCLDQERPKLTEYTERVFIVFETEEMANRVHKQYKFPEWSKWWNGLKVLCHQAGVIKEIHKLPLLTIRVPQVSKILWQNVGEQLGAKMATKIKSFVASLILIAVCWLLLYFPMKFSLGARTADANDAQLTLLQKFIPIFTALVLVAISILFRIYMEQLALNRNPKDDMQKSKFVLLTTVFFHFIFYLIVPTIFFTFGSGINRTIKLYVVSEQARTFIIVQIILAFIDVPYQRWKKNKNLCLSDQREGFKYSQRMLHAQVGHTEYPLGVRLQIMFRIWSFALFYSFFLPYMMLYMLVALIILYWLEKRNIYKHYSLRKRININLESEFLIIYVNIFLLYQCFIYCFNATEDWKVIAAVSVTIIAIFVNLLYWLCFNTGERNVWESKAALLEDYDGSIYQAEYETYLESIQKPLLDDFIRKYLESVPDLDDSDDSSKANNRDSILEMSYQYYPESGSGSD